MSTEASFQTGRETSELILLSTSTMTVPSDFLNNLSTPESPAQWSWSPLAWEWWEVLQLILSLVGIIGNLLVILVIFRARRRRCSTDTLIAGLAGADFLTSVFIIPHRQVQTLPNTFAAQFYCRMIHSSVLMWTSICASIFTLTTISVERFMAVRYPFVFQRLFTPKRVTVTIIIIWLSAFTINTLCIYVNFIRGNQCVVEFPSLPFQKFIGVSYFLVEYLLPVFIMVCAHILTIRSLKKRAQTLSGGKATQDLRLLAARRRVIETLFIVVIIFIICWTPDQFGFLAFSVGLVGFSHMYSPIYRSFVVLAFVNSCANPIIYAARNANFRKALKELFGVVPEIKLQSIFAANEDSTDKSASSTSKLTAISKQSV